MASHYPPRVVTSQSLLPFYGIPSACPTEPRSQAGAFLQTVADSQRRVTQSGSKLAAASAPHPRSQHVDAKRGCPSRRNNGPTGDLDDPVLIAEQMTA